MIENTAPKGDNLMTITEPQSKLVDYPALRIYRNRYKELSYQPLLITCHLRPNSPLGANDPVNLDDLLAHSVVQDATLGAMLPHSEEPYDLPLPLACLWRSEEGLPLWASTCFVPVGENISDTIYRHKRAPSGQFVGTKTGRHSVKTTAGRWMERQDPQAVRVCFTWQARAIGNAEEIMRLLRIKTAIGKNRSRGMGEVKEWTWEPLPLDTTVPAGHILVNADPDPDDHLKTETVRGTLLRPVPMAAASALGYWLPVNGIEPVGWTPPQWKPSLFRPGWRFGSHTVLQSSPVSPQMPDIDYFAAVDDLGSSS